MKPWSVPVLSVVVTTAIPEVKRDMAARNSCEVTTDGAVMNTVPFLPVGRQWRSWGTLRVVIVALSVQVREVVDR